MNAKNTSSNSFSLFTMAIIALLWLSNTTNASELCTLSQQHYGEAYFSCLDSSQNEQSWQSSIDQGTRESHIFFSKGGANLDGFALAQLQMLVPVLETSVMLQSCLHLVGHSDTSGGVSVNQDISLKRAQAVAQYLRRSLKNPSRIEAVSAVGETQPLAGLETTSPANRRVAILAHRCPSSNIDIIAAQVVQR